ncbi:MAG: hypothetical protein EOP58_05310 [Sphingomonadales bacterium]|nr:MAG: hypothetical protein EOP58_05310 [Sphingomonadales bacterium]
MKFRYLSGSAAAAVAVLLAPAAIAQSQSPASSGSAQAPEPVPQPASPDSARTAGEGTLSGQIQNTATGEYLRNAIIEIVDAAGKRRTATSGDAGRYEIRDLPAGDTMVRVVFTGYATLVQTVRIAGGSPTELNVDMQPTGPQSADSDEIVVVGSVREGDARAIMNQRQSMDIKNVLSAESYGDIDDGNPAEFLKFMPGVDTDGSNGTAVNAFLRGMPADYTQVTLNGAGLATADANTGAGSARVFSFESMSLAGIDSIEISKTTSADVDANAPAGTINIRTKRAFDRRKRLLQVRLSGATHADLFDSQTRTGPDEGGFGGARFLPNADILYSESLFGKRLGVLASLGYTDTYIEREEITASRNYVPTARSADPLAITSLALQTQARETSRLAATLNLDFRATDRLILTLATNFNRGTVYQQELTPTVTTGARTAGVTGDAALDFTTNQSASTRTLVVAGTVQYKINKTFAITPGFEWEHEGLRIDGFASYSRATSRYDSPAKGQVTSLTSAIGSTGNFSASRGDILDADWTIAQVSGPDWGDAASFTLTGRPTLRTTNGATSEVSLKSGAMNISYDTEVAGIPVVFKTGFKVQDAEYAFDNRSAANQYTYVGAMTNAEFLSAIRSNNQLSFSDAGASVRSLSGRTDIYLPSMGRVYDLFSQNPQDWQRSFTAANWYSANVENNARYRETTAAVYGMATATPFEQLRLRAGLRWEQTRTRSRAFDPLSAAAVQAAGYAVSASTGRATTIEGLEYQYLTNPRVDRKGRYDFFFPSASAKYLFGRSTELQLGYSRTILRPPVSVISGAWTIDEVDNIITAPNPSLEPAISDNFSARLARYFEPVGIVAINFYQNKVKGLFQEQELTAEEFGYTGTEYANYTFVTTTTVGGDAVNIRGIEFEFNHALTYLPSPLDGLSIRGSYMYNHPEVPIVRVADQVASFSLTYSKGPLKLFLNSVWTGDKYRSTTPTWFEERIDMNLSGSYAFAKGWEAFFSLRNLLNEPINVIVPGSLATTGTVGDHSAIYIHNGRSGTFGVRARF